MFLSCFVTPERFWYAGTRYVCLSQKADVPFWPISLGFNEFYREIDP